MNQVNKRISALFAAAVLASVLGCTSTPKQEGTGEYMSDSWITSKVKTVLIDDSKVKAREINVVTFKGEVQLSGSVDSYDMMRQAVRDAEGVKGVTSVKNEMRVK